MKKKAKTVVLGVTGSIAAYKAAGLVRSMTDEEWNVQVVMTEAAGKFVGELTFRTLSGNPVAMAMFDTPGRWNPEHIGLADIADVFVIAPCTANVLAKAANGIADDLLTCSFLATAAPKVIAPAMNEKMWDNRATQANVATLRKRGIEVIDTESGYLACGYRGRGRLAAIDAIIRVIKEKMEDSR
ncbi:MAG: flavoprotein [Verrucomicrobiota bacterium]